MINLEYTKTASFDVDAQYTFTPECPGELPVTGGTEIVIPLNQQAQFAQYRVGSKDAHSPSASWVANEHQPMFSPLEGRNIDVAWNLHAVPGTRGFELIEGLPTPADYDYFVWKGVEPDMHPYGACYHDLGEQLSTGVIEFLKVKGVENVIVGGLATDYCVKTTALQLAKAGFNVIVNLAACRGIDLESTRQSLTSMLAAGIHVIENCGELRG